MGLFDFFKKKPAQQVPPTLSLEGLLQKAAIEPSYRPELYKRLFTDDLVILTEKSELEEGIQTLQQNTTVNIVSFADGKIPVFTSTERIFDNGVVKQKVEYMQLKGENLFELSKGATFLLNPYSDYGKELLPGEVESILNGEIPTSGLKTLLIKKETEVQIGQPAKYPTDIVNSLKTLFASKPNVKAAYLGWIFNPESGELPHYIFGIDAKGGIEDLLREAGAIVTRLLPSPEFADFIKIDTKSGISNYFINKVDPFYKA